MSARVRREPHPDDLALFARMLAAHDIHVPQDGKWHTVRCPFHDDSKPSMRVNAGECAFKCMGCDVRGGGVRAWPSYEQFAGPDKPNGTRRGRTNGKADNNDRCKNADDQAPRESVRIKKKRGKKAAATATAGAKQAAFDYEHKGRRDGVPPHFKEKNFHRYADAEGNELFLVARYGRGRRKRCKPYYWDGKGYVNALPDEMKSREHARPLFNLLRFLDAPNNAVVFITEGEGKCEVLRRALKPKDNAVVMSFSNGANSWDKTDYSPIAGRRVILVADENDAGRDCMRALGMHLRNVHECATKLVERDDVESKRDIQDVIERAVKNGDDGRAAAFDYIGEYGAEWLTPEIVAERRAAMDEEIVASAGKQEVRRGDKENLVNLIAAKADFRFDERTEQPEMRARFKGDDEWKVIKDIDVTELQDHIMRTCMDGNRKSLFISKKELSGYAKLLASRNRVDKAVEYFKSLPPWNPERDWKPLFTEFCKRLGVGRGKEPSELDMHILLAGLCGTVKRAFEPGCLLRTFIVLIGCEGGGKSSVWGLLFPKVLRDALVRPVETVNVKVKELFEAVAGALIIEWAEMTERRRADIAKLKNVLTMMNPAHRAAFGEFTYSRPRFFTFAITTNEERPLPNVTGHNTRFMPLWGFGQKWKDSHTGPEREKVGKELEAFLDANRDKIWACAIHMVNNEGHNGSPPSKFWDQMEKRNEGARDRDETIENIIEDEFKYGRLQAGTPLDWIRLRVGVSRLGKEDETDWDAKPIHEQWQYVIKDDPKIYLVDRRREPAMETALEIHGFTHNRRACRAYNDSVTGHRRQVIVPAGDENGKFTLRPPREVERERAEAEGVELPEPKKRKPKGGGKGKRFGRNEAEMFFDEDDDNEEDERLPGDGFKPRHSHKYKDWDVE